MTENPSETPAQIQDGIVTLDLARAAAIASYSGVEHSLHHLFQFLSGTTTQVAGVIFFRIGSARARLTMIDRLKRIKYGGEHAVFFNSLLKCLRRLDEERNQVIHWSIVQEMEADGGRAVLTPPNFWDRTGATPEMSVRDLDAFAHSCRIYSQMLIKLLSHWQGADVPASWLGIFQQEVAYPPPNTLQLFPKP